MSIHLPYNPVQGVTYSLFGENPDTGGYFSRTGSLLDSLLAEVGDKRRLLSMLQRAGKKNLFERLGSRWSFEGRGKSNVFPERLSRVVESRLSEYTQTADRHLAGLSLRRRLDRVIGMPRPAYHFAMLEIELVNRMHKSAFLGCGYKMALLPHCLSDFLENCRKERGEIDYICGKCSGICHIHEVSDILAERSIEPYIWMEMGRRTLFKSLRRRGVTTGVLGIACIPELVAGMRMCMNHGVPVVGVPINANRCARWMDSAHENSVSIDALRALLTPA